MKSKVVVIGGGVSGLSAAHRLVELDPDLHVTLLEAGDRVGGLIRTERTEVNGAPFVIERGPDAILTQMPWALDLAERLGIGDLIVRTRDEFRGAYVVYRGRLERIPEGFSLMGPTQWTPFLNTPLLSPVGKMRAASEVFRPARRHDADESLQSFVTRRFGHELFERLAQPLVGGIYGADPDQLSIEATMPRFVEYEREFGSVIKGMRAARRNSAGQDASGARYGLFVSFQGGNQTLIDALEQRLGDRIRRNFPVRKVQPRSGGGFRLIAKDSDSLMECDQVVLAMPAFHAAQLVGDFDTQLAGRMISIPYGSSATVTFAWNRKDIPHALDAYGFVVPAAEETQILASTWASQKWPGRAPDDKALIRVFIGGTGRESLLERTNDELVELAQRELGSLIGVKATPLLVRCDRMPKSTPQYVLGHADRVQAIEDAVALTPGLHLAGNAYRGVGIPNAIHAGEQAAERVVGNAG